MMDTSTLHALRSTTLANLDAHISSLRLDGECRLLPPGSTGGHSLNEYETEEGRSLLSSISGPLLGSINRYLMDGGSPDNITDLYEFGYISQGEVRRQIESTLLDARDSLYDDAISTTLTTYDSCHGTSLSGWLSDLKSYDFTFTLVGDGGVLEVRHPYVVSSMDTTYAALGEAIRTLTPVGPSLEVLDYHSARSYVGDPTGGLSEILSPVVTCLLPTFLEWPVLASSIVESGAASLYGSTVCNLLRSSYGIRLLLWLMGRLRDEQCGEPYLDLDVKDYWSTGTHLVEFQRYATLVACEIRDLTLSLVANNICRSYRLENPSYNRGIGLELAAVSRGEIPHTSLDIAGGEIWARLSRGELGGLLDDGLYDDAATLATYYEPGGDLYRSVVDVLSRLYPEDRGATLVAAVERCSRPIVNPRLASNFLIVGLGGRLQSHLVEWLLPRVVAAVDGGELDPTSTGKVDEWQRGLVRGEGYLAYVGEIERRLRSDLLSLVLRSLPAVTTGETRESILVLGSKLQSQLDTTGRRDVYQRLAPVLLKVVRGLEEALESNIAGAFRVLRGEDYQSRVDGEMAAALLASIEVRVRNTR